jgi:hypothetical protein
MEERNKEKGKERSRHKRKKYRIKTLHGNKPLTS